MLGFLTGNSSRDPRVAPAVDVFRRVEFPRSESGTTGSSDSSANLGLPAHTPAPTQAAPAPAVEPDHEMGRYLVRHSRLGLSKSTTH